jgi:hypothetical protein
MTDCFAKDPVLHIKKQPMASCPCAGLAALSVWLLSGTATALAEDWPQWRGPNRDGVWSEAGILQTFPPGGYQEVSRARVLEPAVTFSGRKCAWAAPAYANRRIYARTNIELVCASLAAEP